MGRLFKRGRVYYAWIPKPTGGTKKVSTNCTDERAAHARAAELERDSLDPGRAAAKTATLRDALERLVRQRAGEAKAGKKSKHTVDFYLKKSGVLLDGLAEVLNRSPKAAIFLHEVSAALVDDYIEQRRGDGAGDNTISKELTTWRAAMRIAKRRKLFPLDLDEVFPVGFSPNYKPRKRFVSPEDFLKLYAAMVRPIPLRKPKASPETLAILRARRDAGESIRSIAKDLGMAYPTATRLARRDAEPENDEEQGHALFAIVCFSIATSAEWSAIWRARREDIAPDLGKVAVRGSKNDNRERELPIVLYAFGVLLDYARRHGDGELSDEQGTFLFKGSHASSFRARLAEACKRAGIEHLSPNDLRRTHGHWLRKVGVAPATIAPSMGHADARMVERVYGKLTPMELAGVQQAQISNPGGLLMGGATTLSSTQETSGAPAEMPISPVFSSAQGRNRTADTGIFNPLRPPSNGPENSDLRTRWDANGQLTTPARMGSGEVVEVRDVQVDPPPVPPAPLTPRPGLARAEPIDVDGRLVYPDEELSDLAALLPLGGRR